MYQVLHESLMHPAVLEAWRPRGRYVPVHEWERFLTSGLHYGAAVRTTDGSELVGLVELRDYDPTDQYGYLSAAAAPGFIGSGLMIEACSLFLDEVFSRFALRKVYVLTTDLSTPALGAGFLSIFETEGMLKEHVFINGAHRDVRIASVSRAGFCELLSSRRAASLLPPGEWQMIGTEEPNETPDVTVEPLLAAYALAEGVDFGSATYLADIIHDSLAQFEFLVTLEEQLGRRVPDDLFASLETVGDVLGWLRV